MSGEIEKRSTLADVCFAVCTALHRCGTTAVLTGGSAASFYAPIRYQSHDADFVLMVIRNGKASAEVMSDLGFVENGGVYAHSQTSYTVEFPPGPLSVGAALIREYETIRRERETLYVITRTDSVCDRLAAFYHWGDRSSLRTALDVAASGPIDLSRIATWSASEGEKEKFHEFEARYEVEANSDRQVGKDA